MNELLPCPFCGGEAAMQDHEDGANYIECAKCGASTNLQYSLKDDGRPDLIERWNRRVAPQPSDEPSKQAKSLFTPACKHGVPLHTYCQECALDTTEKSSNERAFDEAAMKLFPHLYGSSISLPEQFNKERNLEILRLFWRAARASLERKP